jgi:ornithine cyclodeaminase/alanine dehydrogenase-like protein (mu-crystallin family)
MSGAPIVLLSGSDLQRLLRPATTIAALRETYAALADSRGDRGRSVGFTVEGGSIHVKSGLLPGSHLAFASKVNVNLPENATLRGLPTIQGVVVVSDAKDEAIGDHNGATDARPSCLAKVRMASKVQGVVRDCPVRLRLKYRVHAPE